ncbi:hypothetical protein GCM10009679_20390 [Saccharothrix algeriensis]|uniref:Uncharacterized protein n=1 Tax=Catellatospora bangladeshensis TaxID=310355 RepID=A0A8J3JRW9_9ACTN|nr:hypothetical protein Cba03nite_34380 [Catellatospora bangladeshensis]
MEITRWAAWRYSPTKGFATDRLLAGPSVQGWRVVERVDERDLAALLDASRL